MAQPALHPLPPNVAGAPARRGADLAATVQYLVFEPGLYALDLGTPGSTSTDIGLSLPAIRLDPAPQTALRPGRASVIGPTQEGWFSRSDESVFVLVVGGQAGILLTIYRANDGMAAPEIRFRTIRPLADQQQPIRPRTSGPSAAGRVAAVAAVQDTGPAGAVGMEEGAVPLLVLAHVSGVGDVRTLQSQWLGVPGSGNAIEGFSVAPQSILDPKTIEYQAILGSNWSTPWFGGGEYCGSRGLLLPLLGFRIRLTETAADHECVYWGRFVGGQASGPHHDAEACQAGDAPLEAIRVVIRPRAAPTGIKQASANEGAPRVKAGSTLLQPPQRKGRTPK